MSAELVSNRGMSCETHPKEWQLRSQLGQWLCVQCCQSKLLSGLETQLTRRHTLEGLESAMSGDHSFLHWVPLEGVKALVLTLLGLLCDADADIAKSAKDCLTIPMNQMTEQNISEYLFENLIQIMKDKTNWNEWAFALTAQVLSRIEILRHPLKEDIDFLMERLVIEFNSFSNPLKKSVLDLFTQFYDNLNTNPLFGFEHELHLKTLQMIFNAFETQIDSPNDTIVLINSMELLTKLSKIDNSIVNSIISEQKLTKHMKQLLGYECEELSARVLNLICDYLETENIQQLFANILVNEMFDILIQYLHSSKNPFFSNLIVDCINLVLPHVSEVICPTHYQPLSGAIVKALELFVSIKNELFFKNGLTALKEMIKRNSNTKLMSEFEFFTSLDLFEYLVSNPNLFTIVVNFMAEFMTTSVIPVVVPIKIMKRILNKVLDNIWNNTSPDVECDDFNESITRTTAAVNLMKRYLGLITLLKEREVTTEVEPDFEDESVYIVNGETKVESIETNSTENCEINVKIVGESKSPEIYEFIKFCLSKLEKFFDTSVNKLSVENNFEQNSLLLQSICESFVILIKNNLFVIEDIIPFIERMFSKGNVLTVMQFLFSKYEFSNSEFNCCLTSLISTFLSRILNYEHNKDMSSQLEKAFSRETIEETINQMNDNLVHRLDSLWFQTNDSIHQFYSIFFALNYYCFKFDSKKKYRIEENYNYFFTRILNQYLRRHLSVDKESILTVKHSLFLSHLTDLDRESICTLIQFFNGRDKTFYSLYYTNHIKLLKWLFEELNCDLFCEFALNAFFLSIPEKYMNFENKQIISSFFSLIHSNDRALQLFITLICDSIDDNDSTLEVIKYFLEDSEQFIDESEICNNWNLFCAKVFEQMPQIVGTIINKIQICVCIELTERDEQKLRQLLDLFCRMISNDWNKSAVNSKTTQFNRFLADLSNFIDENLSIPTIETIFEFFGLCFTTSLDFGFSLKRLTEDMLNSQICIILMTYHLDNDLATTEGKELSLFLLSVLSQNKSKYEIQHQFVYELDMSRLIDWLNSESKFVTESAFYLLLESLEIDSYFMSENKSKDEKIEEMRKLLLSLQNAIFRGYISLGKALVFLKSLINDLSHISTDLSKHMANHPWFRAIIDQYIEDKEENVFEEELIDFLIFFFKMDSINRALIGIPNEFVKKMIETLEDKECDRIRDNSSLKTKIFDLLIAIDSGVYRNTLNTDLKNILRDFLDSNSFQKFL